MPSLFSLKLYTTSSCHLCEEAYQLLLRLPIPTIHLIEIADDDQLLDCYGTRIPVLQRTDNQSELNWPFDEEQIMTFINA